MQTFFILEKSHSSAVIVINDHRSHECFVIKIVYGRNHISANIFHTGEKPFEFCYCDKAF